MGTMEAFKKFTPGKTIACLIRYQTIRVKTKITRRSRIVKFSIETEKTGGASIKNQTIEEIIGRFVQSINRSNRI